MKCKATLINRILLQDHSLSDKDDHKSPPKQSDFFVSDFLYSKLSVYSAFLVFGIILTLCESTLATVYFNCKVITSLNDDNCQNFTKSKYSSENTLSENTLGNQTIRRNTEVALAEPELMIESTNFNFPAQTLNPEDQLLVNQGEVLRENLVAQENRIDANDNLSPSQGEDPELGTLLLQEIEPQVIEKEEKPLFYLIGNFGYMRSNNIFAGINPVDDNLFRTGVTLLTLPALSDQTSMIASVGGNFVSYGEQSTFDYDQLNLNLGIIHNFDSNLTGQFGWKNRYLFDGNTGSRFLNDHSLYLGVNYQKPLTEVLTLNSGYQLQSNFSDPVSRSQIINSFNVGVDYQIIDNLKAGLNYQLALSNFTEQDRSDTYHELMGSLRYHVSPNTSLEMFLGHSFGDSSNGFIDYDGFIFGLGVNFYLF